MRPLKLNTDQHRRLAERHLELTRQRARRVMVQLSREFAISRETARAYINRRIA